MPDSKTINLVHEDGSAITVPVDQAAGLLADGRYHVESGADVAARTLEAANEERYGGIGGKLQTAAEGVLRAGSFGITDALGDEDERRARAGRRAHNSGSALVGEIVGGAIPIGAGGLAAKAGRKVAGSGGGAAAQIARSGVAGVTEGGIQAVGDTVSQVALSDRPLDLEHIAASLSSNVLYGGLAGGVAGTAAKGLERGLTRAKSALDDVAARPLGTLGGTPDDLARLDKKGLKAAEKAELEAIEAARVPRRAEVADEIRAFRKELKEQKVWLATKDVPEVKADSIGKRTLKADKALDSLLDDPRALAESPQSALRQLRIQEAALDDLVTKHGDTLRAKFANDTSGERLKALDNAAVALEKNRAIQAKIADLASKPQSARLQSIADATEALNAPKPQKGIADAAQDAAMGYALGELSGVQGLGTLVAGARFAGPLLKKMKIGSTENAARASKAVGAFLDVTRKVQPAAPVLATKVLGAVRYGEQQEERRKTKRERAQEKPASLVQAFKARSAEVRAAVAPAMDGSGAVQARPEVRQRVAKQLSPIAAADPVLADRLETLAARRVEFLASKLPRRPDAFGIQVGPDKWQPSDMEMRTWARYVAAVEDPGAIVERLADGSVTPEDAETMRAVYPEMYADVQQQILEQLPVLRATLPYQRRLAFSVFSGVPVDPALDPQVLSRLQASFAMEQGTEGGTMAPRAQPAFGSVSKPEPTAAQQRGA